MSRSYAWVWLCFSVLSCRSQPEAPAEPTVSPTPVASAEPTSADYARAGTGAELRALMLRDLDRRATGRAYAGLKAFTATSLEEGHASRGHLVFEETPEAGRIVTDFLAG